MFWGYDDDFFLSLRNLVVSKRNQIVSGQSNPDDRLPCNWCLQVRNCIYLCYTFVYVFIFLQIIREHTCANQFLQLFLVCACWFFLVDCSMFIFYILSCLLLLPLTNMWNLGFQSDRLLYVIELTTWFPGEKKKRREREWERERERIYVLKLVTRI